MLLDEIGSLLATAGVATTGASSTGWTLKYRGLTPEPARQVVVIATGGLPQEGIAPIDRPTVQVLVRGSSMDGSVLEAKVGAVVTAVNRRDGVVNGWPYVDIQKEGDVLYLGLTDNQRPLYSVNFWTVRSRTS